MKSADEIKHSMDEYGRRSKLSGDHFYPFENDNRFHIDICIGMDII